MISGDQRVFEAIIRTLPARRRQDEIVVVSLIFRDHLTPAVRAMAEQMRKVNEAMQPLADALVAADRAEKAKRENDSR